MVVDINTNFYQSINWSWDIFSNRSLDFDSLFFFLKFFIILYVYGLVISRISSGDLLNRHLKSCVLSFPLIDLLISLFDSVDPYLKVIIKNSLNRTFYAFKNFNRNLSIRFIFFLNQILAVSQLSYDQSSHQNSWLHIMHDRLSLSLRNFQLYEYMILSLSGQFFF